MTRTELDQWLWELCEPFHPGVTLQVVRGRTRKRYIVNARHFFWALQFHSGRTMSAIARREGRNHTGIMHGIRRAEAEWGEALFAELARYSRARAVLRVAA